MPHGVVWTCGSASIRRELVPQFRRQCLGGIPRHGKPAARLRPVERERRDDRRAAGLERLAQARDVAPAIIGVDQEMEHGAVVPDVHRLQRPLAGDVGRNPGRRARRGGEARSCAVERRDRDVQHREAFQPARRQRIHEVRIAAADIEHAGVASQTGCLHQPQRYQRHRLEPTDVLFGLGAVDALPMCLSVHGAAAWYPRHIPRASSNFSDFV